MTNYLEFLNPNRKWSLGNQGQLQYVNVSGDLSVNNITTSDISINNSLNSRHAIIDTALFKNITVSENFTSSNLEVSNFSTTGDISFNSNVRIDGNILSSTGSRGLYGQFLRATISGWDWQYLDASYVSDTSFNSEITRLDASLTQLVYDLSNNNKNNYSNKKKFDISNILTNNAIIQDLSSSFFNTITPINLKSKILINLKCTLYCSFALEERISLEVWRDLSMISQDNNIGSVIASGGLSIPYNFTFLDEPNNINLIKYYLKYKLENNNSGEKMGLINIETNNINGSSNIILREL
jgi:hypothetical protein